MTVEDLLTMRTGHEKMTPGSVWRRIRTSWVAEFFKIPVVHRPGTVFVYTSAASYMLSAIITRATGQTLAEYLLPRLFEPLGITDYAWAPGPDGVTPGGNGLSWRLAESLKLGVLHLNKGLWNAKRVLPEGWAEAVRAPHVPGRYGYQWWLRPDGVSYANGIFGQFAFVFPDHDAVLATTAAIPASWSYPARLANFFPKAFGDSPASPEGGEALAERLAGLRLLPRQRAAVSPLAERITGRTFAAQPNEDGVRFVRFDFAGDRCRFTLADHRGEHVVEAGLDGAVEGRTTMTGNRLHQEYQPESLRVSARGRWEDENVFEMTWVFLETPYRDTVVCRFDATGLTLDRRVNVNFGPKSRPTLRAELA